MQIIMTIAMIHDRLDVIFFLKLFRKAEIKKVGLVFLVTFFVKKVIRAKKNKKKKRKK